MMEARGLKDIKSLTGIALPNPITDFMELSGVKNISYLENIDDCVSCGNCCRCPYLAINLSKEVEDLGRPVIDPSKCIGCRMCNIMCPTDALGMRKRTERELELCPE
eukprot:TRINITY_DN1905_c0_g1_i1.p1 TRINITY_DN1905_c0_g1~~TRINITY_DN1905_c0_g1_i1.p1  ORF type:complete len:107 (-),score=47.18 TRINITY_DN1905_c0_g1_i1:41-361(-)